MGLDITVTRRKTVICPNCGEIVATRDVDSESSGGKAWYDILESIGYYVPYEQRTEENDWYGKDMILSKANADKIYNFAKEGLAYNSIAVSRLIASALYENDLVVINADW